MRLQSANFPISIKLCVSQFIRGLPVIAAFNTLRAALPTHIAQAADHDYGAFVTITESALELDTIFKSAVDFSRPSRPPNVRTQDSSSRSSIVSAVPDSTKPTVVSSAPAVVSAKICTNCGRRGHLFPTCFEPGGGMEGRHDEYKRDKGKYVAMLAASLEEACNMMDNDPAEEVVDDLPPNTLDDPTIPATDPISSSVSQFNDNFRRDLYAMRDPKSYLSTISPISSPVLDHTAFLSLGNAYNSCLDSGCTDHIVKDRYLFQTYDVSGAVEIGTANCGSLSAKGSGDVSFRVPYHDRFVIFTMRGCLHAPDAPINLISVGALTDNRLTVTFRPDAPTVISYPDSDPDLPGFSFTAPVFCRLSLLKLDFVLPNPSPHAFPAITFPKTNHMSTLWHRHFGHLGMEATREALTKEYVKGITFSGPILQEHCIACIVGKSPQHSHRRQLPGHVRQHDLSSRHPYVGQHT